MKPVPEPSEDAIPLNEPLTASIGGGQRARFKWQLTQNVGTILLPVLAATKHDQTSYKVWVDGGNPIYGPKQVPPTELDDKSICFWPAREFAQELKVEIANLRDPSTSPREYTVQPIGWEEASE